MPDLKRRAKQQVPSSGRSEIQDLGDKKITFKAKHGPTQSMRFRLEDLTKSLAAANKICTKNRGWV